MTGSSTSARMTVLLPAEVAKDLRARQRITSRIEQAGLPCPAAWEPPLLRELILLRALSGDVSLRKHAHFVAEALEHELHRLRLEAALDVSAGAWSDEDHPDLADGPAIDRWIAEGRV